MQFDSISAFLDMGGYGFYVWLSYGTSVLAIGLLILLSYQNHQKTLQQIAQRYIRENKRKEAAKQYESKQSNTEITDILKEENESAP